MNKAELIDAVADASGVSKSIATKVLDAFSGTLKDTLSAGNIVQWIGLGTWDVVDRAARTGRDPRTGDPITIKATKKVRFKVGKAFKEAVNG